MENKETVCAVVVTYNRKELLIECLEALRKQTWSIQAIYLIDNASTDETPELLLEKQYIKKLPPKNLSEPWESEFEIKNLTNGNTIKVHYVKMHENTGGAGGFHEGVKRGHEKGYDWLWLMDDDTIPLSTCLDELIKADETARYRVRIGFIASRVIWNNGDVHLMNIPDIRSINHNIPFNELDDISLTVINSCSFVSTLLSSKALLTCGLPLKEMFIWGDDVEFFRRISRSGFVGIYCSKSVAKHKTIENYTTNIFIDKAVNIWKYKYGIRNNLYLAKVEKGLLYFFVRFVYNLAIVNLRICLFRNDNKLKAIKINTFSTISALFFSPKVEYPTFLTLVKDTH